MRRRSATTGLIVDYSHVVQETAGLLFEPDWDAAIFMSEHTSRIEASSIMRAESSRSELVSVLHGLVLETNAEILSGGQGLCHTML